MGALRTGDGLEIRAPLAILWSAALFRGRGVYTNPRPYEFGLNTPMPSDPDSYLRPSLEMFCDGYRIFRVH